MKKIYALVLFIFSISSIHSQTSICDDPTPVCGDINPTFNVTGQPTLGGIGCLSSTPNPSWFVFRVGFMGNIDYNLHQGDNAPSFNNQDIDFICWGPFNSLPNCNTQLYDYPDGNTTMTNNVVACSFSGSATENFTIPNAIPGSYYVMLTTNFSNTPGYFVMEQTNAAVPGAGTSDCNIICGLYLAGPTNTEILSNDIIFCDGSTSYNLKCNFRAENQSALSYQWYLNNVLQPALTTQQITVTQNGTWKVVATNTICNTPAEDSVNITFSAMPAINNTTYIVNGPLDTCNPTINLTDQLPYILNGLNPNDYTIEYFPSENDFFLEANQIINPTAFNITENTEIYIKVANNDALGCYDYTSFTIDIDCANTELIITTQPQDQTINSNDTVVFTTNITNATTYQWQMSTDGINWTTITNGGTNPTFSGVDTNTLTLNNVPGNYNGNMFRVMSTSATDRKTSNPASLSIVLSNDSFELSEFSIFPNPTKNNFTLQIDKLNLIEDLKYAIYDLNGRKLLENKINSLETIVPFEKYQSGIYLFEISTKEIKAIKKIVKN
ncbi:MAG: T9SS type A sorting domain-containing protein [Bacteroidota bacterium]